MASSSEENPVDVSLRIRGLLEGAFHASALHAAVKCGVMDVLVRAQGPLSPEEIAKELGPTYIPSRVMRLCRMIAPDGLLVESPDGKYSANLATQMLATKGPMWGLTMHWLDPSILQAWSCVDRGLAGEGDPFALAHGGKTVFEFFQERPDSSQTWFNQAMSDYAKVQMDLIFGAFGDGFKALEGKTVVDVGGGLGHLVGEAVKRYPGIQGINFDLPHVIDSPQRAEGVKHVPGNFFEGPIPSADAILLKLIMHDWDDAANQLILQQCKAALKDDGYILIIDFVVPPPGPPYEPTGSHAKFLDMHMMAVCPGGMERTKEQWENLVAQSGLFLAEMVCPPPAPVNIIMAKHLP